MAVLKVCLILSMAVGIVLGLPLGAENQSEVNQNAEVRILRNEREDFEDGGYRFYYETSDGQKREEELKIFEVEGEEPTSVVTGYYTYVGTDGVTYKVNYIADNNGFRADGDHLPKDKEEGGDPGDDGSVGLPASALLSLVG